MLGQEREAHRAVQVHSIVMVTVSGSGTTADSLQRGLPGRGLSRLLHRPPAARAPFPWDPPCHPPRPREARSAVSGPAPVPAGARRCGVHVQGGAGGGLSPTVTQRGTGTKLPFGSVTWDPSPRRTDGPDTKKGLFRQLPAHSPRQKQWTCHRLLHMESQNYIRVPSHSVTGSQRGPGEGTGGAGSPTAMSPDLADSAAVSGASPRDQPATARATVTQLCLMPRFLFRCWRFVGP